MVQVAEELIEAVQRRQVFVQVAEVVLAELAGGVAQGLERGGDRAGLSGMPTSAPAWPTVVRPVRSGNSPGDEVRPARRAARLGVVVGEQHALRGQLVEVRRLAGHHAAVVGADVEPADVVSHDEDDVRLLAIRPFVFRFLFGSRGLLVGRPALAAGRGAWALRSRTLALRNFVAGIGQEQFFGTSETAALAASLFAGSQRCRSSERLLFNPPFGEPGAIDTSPRSAAA